MMRDPLDPATDEQKVGQQVVAQANDNGIFNTNPVIATSAITGIVAAVGSILVIGGYVEGSEVDAIKAAAGEIVPAAFLIASVVAGIWGRMHAYSPKSAARIAVANAAQPVGAVPTLDPPP